MSEKDPIPTSLPINHAEIAQERVLELHRWREAIPHFVVPAEPQAMRRLTSAATVPPKFVELTMVAVANERSLVRLDAATPEHVRDLASYADAYAPLPDELEALAHFIRHSVAAARHTVGMESLMTYAIAQRLAKLPATAHLAPRVADMRRALGRGRKASPETLAKRAAAKAAQAEGEKPELS